VPIKNSETRYSRRCKVCHRPLNDEAPKYKNCGSEDCIRERNRRKSNAWARKHIWGQAKPCAICGTLFKRSQAKKKFCTTPCAMLGAAEVRRHAYMRSRTSKSVKSKRGAS
jgi:hypothetical protein